MLLINYVVKVPSYVTLIITFHIINFIIKFWEDLKWWRAHFVGISSIRTYDKFTQTGKAKVVQDINKQMHPVAAFIDILV